MSDSHRVYLVFEPLSIRTDALKSSYPLVFNPAQRQRQKTIRYFHDIFHELDLNESWECCNAEKVFKLTGKRERCNQISASAHNTLWLSISLWCWCWSSKVVILLEWNQLQYHTHTREETLLLALHKLTFHTLGGTAELCHYISLKNCL